MSEELTRRGLRSEYVHGTSMGAVFLCLGLWIRAKTVDQSSRENAERRAIFVGLWAPTLWLIGDWLERAERRPSSRLARLQSRGRSPTVRILTESFPSSRRGYTRWWDRTRRTMRRA